MNNQIKSKERVTEHGEVYTSEREVNNMLDLVKQETERLDSRFLEPACGDGNFLIKVLERKMNVLLSRYKKNQYEIEKNSVVSKQVAEMMAQSVRKKFNSSIGVATTGNAGPSKGDSDAEIGTVWIAISSDKRIISERFTFGKHRERVIGKAVNKALEMVYREII